MQKILSITLILLLLIPQTVFAKNTDITTNYIEKTTQEISSNWSENYYDKLLIDLKFENIKKDGKTITFEQLLEITNINARNLNEWYSIIKKDPLYNIKETNNKIQIRNPYQAQKIYLESRFPIKDIENYIPYDSYSGIIICNSQKETYNLYHKLISDTNFISVTLDEIISANSMSIELKNKEYNSYGFDKININNLKIKAKEKVVVAVIDSGITKNHSAFKNTKILDGLSLITGKAVKDDFYGHGTHVTSTIVEGTNSLISILPIQVFDKNGTTSFLVIDTALKYASSQNVDCINMSLGFNQRFKDEYNFLDKILYELYLKNIPLIKSAGNSHKSVQIDYPYGKYVISVGALTEKNELAGFTNLGEDIDFVCYGVNIIGALNDLSFGTKTGTSMAAPHITACIALLKSENKNLTIEEICNILEENSIKIKGYSLPVF